MVNQGESTRRRDERAVPSTARFDAVTGATATQVRTVAAASGAALGTSVTVPGALHHPVVTSADGTRLLVTTVAHDRDVTHVTVVDATGDDRADAALAGRPGPSALSGDGRRAVQATSVVDATSTDTHLTVLDSVTGAVVGAPLVLVGEIAGGVTVDPTGTRFATWSYAADSDVTRLTVADIGTGDPVGSPVVIDGAPVGAATADDGAWVALLVSSPGAAGVITRLVVADTATAAVLGGHAVVSPTAAQVVVVDGLDRAVLVRDGPAPETTSVTVLDTARGAVVGTDIVMAGVLERVSAAADSTHVTVTSYAVQSATGRVLTHRTVVDAVTGARVTA